VTLNVIFESDSPVENNWCLQGAVYAQDIFARSNRVVIRNSEYDCHDPFVRFAAVDEGWN
jgi:hypothetical protein